MSFDPYAPYGPVVTSTIRVVTWNVWGRYGTDREARQAGPDSDEIRMLTGRSATAAPGMVFYDAWEVAGDGSPGFTWSNRNPMAAVGLYPDRRFDYILSAWPRRGGVGHPTRCSLLGVRAPGEQQVSDHYGLAADLRY